MCCIWRGSRDDVFQDFHRACHHFRALALPSCRPACRCRTGHPRLVIVFLSILQFSPKYPFTVLRQFLQAPDLIDQDFFSPVCQQVFFAAAVLFHGFQDNPAFIAQRIQRAVQRSGGQVFGNPAEKSDGGPMAELIDIPAIRREYMLRSNTTIRCADEQEKDGMCGGFL